MRILKYVHSNGSKIAVFIGAAMLLAAPYGCSKESKAPATKAEAPAMQGEMPANHANLPGMQDEAKAHFDKGIEASLRGSLDDAIREYEAALKINDNIPEAHNNLGFAYLDKSEFEKAIEHQKRAIELKPDLANAYFGLAMAYERTGKGNEALVNWKEFSKLAQPHSKWWLTAQEHIKALEDLKGKDPKAAPKK